MSKATLSLPLASPCALLMQLVPTQPLNEHGLPPYLEPLQPCHTSPASPLACCFAGLPARPLSLALLALLFVCLSLDCESLEFLPAWRTEGFEHARTWQMSMRRNRAARTLACLALGGYLLPETSAWSSLSSVTVRPAL